MTFAAPAGLVRVRSRVAVHGDVAAIGLVLALSLAIVAIGWGTWGDLDNDTGYDFVAGLKVAHGQLPYRDFFFFYGPLAPALTGLALVVGGTGIGSVVALGLLVASATVAVTYALVRQHAGPLGAALAASITAAVAFSPNQFSFVLPHTGAASMGALLLVSCVLALERRAFLVAGLLAGLVSLTKPEFELAAIAGALALVALRRDRREAIAFAAPAIAIPAAVYGAFLTQVSYGRLVDENLYPKDFFRIAGNHMLHARFPLTAASVVELGGLLALYGIGVAGLTLLSRTLGGPRRRLWLAVAAAGGAAVTAGSLADPEAVRHALHFAWGWIPAGAIVGVVVLLRRRSQVGLAETAALAVLAGTTYHAFFVEAWHAQMGVYATPLAASFLVRLHMTELRSAARVGTVWVAALALAICGLTLKDARAESLTVHGPGGSLRESPEQARVYQRVVDIVVARTRPNEAVLFAPQLAALYAIAQRENPLPQVSLLPGTLAGPAQEREAIRRLDRAQVRLIVIDERLATGYGHTRFGESYDRVLAAWIRSHFTHIARVRDAATSPTLDVWSRRDS